MLTCNAARVIGAGHCLGDESLYVARGSCEDDSAAIDALEISSGLLQRSFHLLEGTAFPVASAVGQSRADRGGLHALDGITVSGSKLLGYEFSKGFFSAFDLEKNVPLCTYTKKLKAGQAITCITGSKECDGLFFFACSAETAVHALLISSGEAPPVVASPLMRVDTGFTEKFKGAVTSLYTHPTKPLLFVVYAIGSVGVYNYSGIKAKLLLEAGTLNASGDAPSVNEGVDDIDDGRSDSGSVISATRPRSGTNATGYSGSISGGPRGPPSDKLPNLQPKALLQAPAVDSSAHYFAVDTAGRLAAVTWGERDKTTTTVLYDVRPATLKADDFQSQTTVTLAPLASFLGAHQQGLRLGPICFHPFEPLLLQAAARSSASSSTSTTSTPTAPLCTPIISALSLMDASLRVVGVQELDVHAIATDELGLENIIFRMPLSISCCPRSGCLVVFFDKHVDDGRVAHPLGAQGGVLVSFTSSKRWRKSFGSFQAPAVTGLSIPPDAYIEGESLLLRKRQQVVPDEPPAGPTPAAPGSSASSTSIWPPLLTMKVSSLLSSSAQGPTQGQSLGKPLSVSYSIYALNLRSLLQPSTSQVGDDDITSTTILLGSLDARQQVSSGSSPNSRMQLPQEDTAFAAWSGTSSEYLFLPRTLHLQDDAAQLHDNLIPTHALLCGSMLGPSRAIAGGTSSLELQHMPAVCFLYKASAGSPLQYDVSCLRHAAFWPGPSIRANPNPSAAGMPPYGVLAISASGRKVKFILLDAWDGADLGTSIGSTQSRPTRGSGSFRPPGTVLDTWVVDTPLESLWPAPVGALTFTLYCASLGGSVANDKEQVKKSLVLAPPGSAVPSIEDFTRLFALERDEDVLDVCWQPIPSRADDTQKPASVPTKSADPQQTSSRHLWVLRRSMPLSPSSSSERGNDSYVPLVGVLTTHRVLLFAIDSNNSLRLLSQYIYSNFQSGSTNGAAVKGSMVWSRGRGDPVSSIRWVGAALVFSQESGAVSYLLAGGIQTRNVCSMQTQLTARRRALGMAHAAATASELSGRLCSLPTALAVAGGLSILGLLPDRMLMAVVVMDEASGLPALHCVARPCLPLEPLVLGLLGLRSANARLFGWKDRQISGIADGVNDKEIAEDLPLRSLITSLCMMYLPARLLPGTRDEAGALPQSQASRKLCLALAEAGPLYRGLAAAVAGVSPKGTEGCGESSHLRWIPPGFKFNAALAMGKAENACLDLLSQRPELQEPFLDPRSYVDLPHPRSAMAQQIAAAAKELAMAGFDDAACRLADIAGDDAQVASLLLRDNADTSGKRMVDLEALSLAVQSTNPALQHKLAVRMQSADGADVELAGNGATRFIHETVRVNGIGGASRRQSLLVLSSPLTCNAATVKLRGSSNGVGSGPVSDLEPGLDLVTFEASQRAHVAKRGGGLGPPTKLRVLAMDQLEDWFGGRLRLETVSVTAGAFGEFSDAAARGLGIGGRSKFDDDEASAPGVMPDGSPRPASWVPDVGLGKEWDKVSGYWRFSDITHKGEEGFCSSGFPGARGVFSDLSKYSGALEVFAPAQTSIAIEATTSNVDQGDDHEKVKALYDVVFLGDACAGGGGVPEVGLRTVVLRGGPLDIGMYHTEPERNKMTIELSVYFAGDESPPSAAADAFCLVQRISGLPPQSPGGAAEHAQMGALWSVFVTADGALCWAFGGMRDPSAAVVKTAPNSVNLGSAKDGGGPGWTHVAITVDSGGSSGLATVLLYINGERAAKADKISLPAFPEQHLASTTIYVGPGLGSGWRLTELRFWADVRGSVEIDSQKDNFLALASKRKRLQFRIKGGKKLFGPLHEDRLQLGEACAELVAYIPPSESAADERDAKGAKSAGGGDRDGSAVDKKGALLAPEQRRGSLLPPGKTPGAGLLAPGPQSVAPSTTAEKPATGKGLLSMPAPGGGSGGGGLSAAARARRASLGTPGAPSFAAFPPPSSSTTRTQALPTLQEESEESSPTPPPDAATAPTRHTYSKPGPANLGPSILSEVVSLLAMDVSAVDVHHCLRSKPLSHPGGIVVLKKRRPQATESAGTEVVVFVSLPIAIGTTTAAVKSTLEMPVSAPMESVICSPSIPVEGTATGAVERGDSPTSQLRRVIAVYAAKALLLFAVTEASTTVSTKLREQVMSVPLVFWKFTSPDSLVIVTPIVVYSWRPFATVDESRPEETSQVPTKMFDRVDIEDPKRWAERRITDVTASSGWVMMTSCLRIGGDGKPAPAAIALASTIITVHQRRVGAGGKIAFKAVAGCFDGPSIVLVALEGDSFVAYSLGLESLGSIDGDATIQSVHNLFEVQSSSAGSSPMIRWRTELEIPNVLLHKSAPCPAAPGGFVCVARGIVVFISADGCLGVCDAHTGVLRMAGPLFATLPALSQARSKGLSAVLQSACVLDADGQVSSLRLLVLNPTEHGANVVWTPLVETLELSKLELV